MASLAWLAAAPAPHLLAPAQGARPLWTAAAAPVARAGTSRPGGAKAPTGLAGLAAGLAVPAAVVGARRVARRSRRQGGNRRVAVALAAAPGGSVPEKELKVLFNTAGGGGDNVTFDQVTRLEGIDGVLEDEAASLEELLLLWGDEQKPKTYKGFCKWYGEVSKLYDDYLWKGAVAPPSAAFDDFYDEEEEIEYTDEELLEDMPTQNVSLQTLKDPTADAQVTAAPAARENVEITRLFREACDDSNRLSFAALREVSEIKQLLEEEELEEAELKEMWAELPRKGDSIDVLAFRDLMGKIDELFEIVEEDSEGGLVPVREGGPAEVLDPKQVKVQLNATIEQLLSNQKEPCGLGGREETDVAVNRLCAQLETCWRETLEYVDEFEVTPVVGEWELVYSTSAKWRRWQSVLNTGDKFIKKAKFDGLVQSFRVVEGALTANEYDMEEIFITEEGEEERGIRGVGAWSCYVQDNVVTGLEDLVLRIQMQAVEYDGDEEDEVKQAGDKILESQMVRTFAYSYMCYIDEDTRIMRTGLTDKSIFVFRRLED